MDNNCAVLADKDFDIILNMGDKNFNIQLADNIAGEQHYFASKKLHIKTAPTEKRFLQKKNRSLLTQTTNQLPWPKLQERVS